VAPDPGTTRRHRTPRDRRSDHPTTTSHAVRLRVLDSFELTVDGEPVDVAHPAQRLLALLAVKHHSLARSYAGGVLWLDHTDERAAGNLRSVLWRLRGLGQPIVDTRNGILQLLPSVTVDLHDAIAVAHRWLAGLETGEDQEAGSAALEGELLPDWYDEWVADERERFRQLRLHALEMMADRLAGSGRWGAAVLAALAAVSADPLRESAHRAVIKVHLAEGNMAEAIRQLRRCERLMIDEVGVPPSPSLAELIRAGTA
jgi:DNA-binding SARP family transcriptional activator